MLFSLAAALGLATNVVALAADRWHPILPFSRFDQVSAIGGGHGVLPGLGRNIIKLLQVADELRVFRAGATGEHISPHAIAA